MPILFTRRHLLSAAAFACAGAGVAQAHSTRVGSLRIGHAWALPAAFGDGQAFMPLLNEGDESDALLGARGDLATLIELRRNARYDDPPEGRFDLLPGKPFAMRPQGPHLRLIGLASPLAMGQRFVLVLDFLNAGETEVEVYVEQTPGT